MNYLDLVRVDYPTQHVCGRCGCVVRLIDSRWIDGAGQARCVGRVIQHAVSPSPLLDQVTYYDRRAT